MKVLTKGIYYYNNPTFLSKLKLKGPNPRLWHDCKRYRKLGLKTFKPEQKARVEIFEMKRTDETITFKCNYCDFEYVLDRHLKLEISRA